MIKLEIKTLNQKNVNFEQKNIIKQIRNKNMATTLEMKIGTEYHVINGNCSTQIPWKLLERFHTYIDNVEIKENYRYGFRFSSEDKIFDILLTEDEMLNHKFYFKKV